jgi:hypothetical protein
MKYQIMQSLIIGALLLAGTPTALRAQPYSIGWDVVAGGGATSISTQYTLSGTIGQWDAGGPLAGPQDSVTGGFWQVPGGPGLTIRVTSPTTVVVSWPAAALGCFVLQATSSLSAPNWAAVPLAVTYADGMDSITVTISTTDQFYRMISDCQNR